MLTETGATSHYSMNRVWYFIKTSGGVSITHSTGIRQHLLFLEILSAYLSYQDGSCKCDDVGRWSLWKLETKCPAQGHLHIEYFKTFYWPNKASRCVAPAGPANSISGRFTRTDHARPCWVPRTSPAVHVLKPKEQMNTFSFNSTHSVAYLLAGQLPKM